MEANHEFENVPVFTGEPVEEEPYNAGLPVPSAPMLQTRTEYHTAVKVQKPRNLDKIVAAVLREAEFAGDAFYYSFPMGGKKVEGPSVGLALAVAREWTNCAVPIDYQETATEWVFNAHFVDLEKGFTVSRVFRQKKGKGRFKKLDDDRAEDMTFQGAQSRAIRNVVLAGIPRWLTDQAKERAKESVIKGIGREGIATATNKALKFLAGYGITEDRVVAVMGKAKAEWGSEDIAALRGMASQLKDGQITPERLFPSLQVIPDPKENTSKQRKTRSDKGTHRAQETPQDAPEPEPKGEVRNKQYSPTDTLPDPPKGISEEQLRELSKVPDDILQEGYVAFGIDPALPLEEMDLDSANDLVQWARTK